MGMGMGMGCGMAEQKNVCFVHFGPRRLFTKNLLLTKWSHHGLCTVVTFERWLAPLDRLRGVPLQENYSKVGVISQEEFQAQREAMSSRPPEGEEADDMLFQMDEQPSSTLLPQTSPLAKAVENSIVSEGSDSMEARAVLEETSLKKSPPTSPLRFYPLPDKSETSAAKDKVCVGLMLEIDAFRFSCAVFEVLFASSSSFIDC